MRVALPTYPFERERFWHAERAAVPRQVEDPADNDEEQIRPLLGRRTATAIPVFEGRLTTARLPYLNDHVVDDQTMVPAAVYVEMALEAALEEIGGGSIQLEDVSFARAMFVADDHARDVQIVLGSPSSPHDARHAVRFEIFSRPVDAGARSPWTSHVRGTLVSGARADVRRDAALEAARRRCTEPVDVDGWYERARADGLDYGAAFRGVKTVWRGNGEAVGFVELQPALASVAGDYAIHPAFMDACFQVIGAGAGERADELCLPVALEALRVDGASASRGWVHASWSASGASDRVAANVRAYDASGALVFEALGLVLQRIARRPARADAATVRARAFSDADLEMTWVACTPPAAPGQLEGRWAILAPPGSESTAIAAAFERAGAAFEILPYEAAPALSDAADLAGVVFVAAPDDSAADALCGEALAVVQALMNGTNGRPPRLWIVTRGARVLPADVPPGVSKQAVAHAALWGLGSVVALEAPLLDCVRVDLDPAGSSYDSLVQALAANDAENEIALRGRDRFAARLRALAPDEREAGGVPLSESWMLASSGVGNLEALALVQAARREPAAGEIEIEVAAAGLNFSDVMKAMGLYPGSAAAPILGAECAGIVTRVGPGVAEWRAGDEVVAIAPSSFARYVTTDAALVVRKPRALRFEEAAGIPVAFLTAAYALERLGRVTSGDRVLIHAATGGVGLAAIQIAQRAGAEIFATAGSPAKRQLLESMGLAGVFDSRTLDFAERIRACTGGRGVDVVLNSLTGDALIQSLDLLAPHGRFLEIGKSDIYQNRRVGLGPFRRAIAFFAIDLERMFRERRSEIQSLLREIGTAIEDGTLRPLPVRIFPLVDAREAFRHMAQAKHVGKIVLSAPRVTPGRAGPIRTDATYLVTGGTGALGLQVAEWLASGGARHIVLASRRPPSSHAETAIGRLRSRGIDVVVHQADVSRYDEAKRLVRALDGGPPLRGLLHAAGVLADATLPNQTPERFRTALGPKVDGAWHLHELTREAPLDLFVLFSSLASVTGSPGQANYSAANASLDALAQYRRAAGLPALSINWGPWADAGMASTGTVARALELQGLRPLPPGEALTRLSRALRPGMPPQVVIASADWSQVARASRRGSMPSLLSSIATNGHPASFDETSGAAVGQSGAATGATAARDALLATPTGDRMDALVLHIREQISRVSGIPMARIDTAQSLSRLGIDSLTSLELFNEVEQTFGVTVSSALMTPELNISTLAEHLTRQLELG